MKLEYKTRGGASPQGKARVYVSGHPVDVERYLEPICQQLFQSQDCAVYYDAEPEGPEDWQQDQRQLEQMQLFVVPVTSRFLYQPNRARQLEFPFAMEHQIPVLPLMQEQGLEMEFNQICGDLQLLNQQDPDPTALPYEEKLEKFLSSVLVGDALAAQVRDAFDAYVFLSYRKKDRRYAQQLMRLIHKNEFCRDIAIWYDEFLTPGENFNQAIAQALEKSSLFALTVTPSLVEDGNYVMRIEYPEARKAGKLILPVEMAPTDRQKLQDCYRDLPPCAQGQDEPGLSAALLEAVQKLAIRENDSSPEHNFFIGLAYLNGIDVEVDRQRALGLITGAAEQGLPEAMDKLVRMYEKGEGVRRDPRQAIAWQERLVKWHQDQFEAQQEQQQGRKWLKELQYLGSSWLELDQLDQAEQVYRQMNQAAQRTMELFGNREERAYLADSLEALGDVARDKGGQQQAQDLYRQSLSIREQMDKEKRTPRLSQDLTNNYIRLGEICLEEEYLIGARGYFELGLSLWEEDDSQRGRQMRAKLLERIGAVWQQDAFPDKALDCYRQSLELWQQLWQETQRDSFQEQIARTYDKMGDIYLETADYEQAQRYCQLSSEIEKKRYEQDPTLTAQRNLAIVSIKEGTLLLRKRDLDGAWQAYQKALEIYLRQAEQIGTIQTQDNLAVIYAYLADVLEERGELAEAQAYLEKCLLLLRQVVRQADSLPHWRKLSDCLQKLGRLCHTVHDFEKMGAYLKESMEICRRTAEERGTVQTRWDLADAYDAIADHCLLTNQWEQALDYQQQRMEIIRQLHQRNPTIVTQRALVACCNALSNVCWVLKRQQEAKQWGAQALELSEKVWKQTQDLKDYRHMAVCCKYMGDIWLAEENWERAKRDYELAVKIHRQLEKKQQTFQAVVDLAFVAQQLARQCKKHGELKEAEAYYLESLRCRRWEWDKNPIPYVGDSLCLIQQDLGDICEKQNRRREARDYYLAATEQAEELGRQTGEEKYQKMSQFTRYLAKQMEKGPLTRMKDKVKSVWKK